MNTLNKKRNRILSLCFAAVLAFTSVPAFALPIENEPDVTSATQASTGTQVVALQNDDALAGFSVSVSSYFAADPESHNVAGINTFIDEVHEVTRLKEEKRQHEAVLSQFPNIGVVTDVNNYLNIRKEPKSGAEIIGKITKFSGMNVLEDTGTGWLHIQSGGVDGYVSAQYVATGEAAKQLALDHATQRVVVDTNRLNVRSGPSTETEVLTQILAGEWYDIRSVQDGWIEILFGVDEFGEDLVGYISADYADYGYYLDEAVEWHPLSEEDLFRLEIVNFAMQYLGGRYVWGGQTLGVGVDCSGFVKAVYAHFGIYLYRCSYEQVNNGRHITREELRPGDLIFYKTTGTGRISHVAMYIGNGQIIHARSPQKGIVINNYNLYAPVAYVNVIGD